MVSSGSNSVADAQSIIVKRSLQDSVLSSPRGKYDKRDGETKKQYFISNVFAEKVFDQISMKQDKMREQFEL